MSIYWQRCPDCGVMNYYENTLPGESLVCASCWHQWLIDMPEGDISRPQLTFNPDVEAWQAMVRLATAEQQYEAMWKLVAWTAYLLDNPAHSKDSVRDWLRALLANR